MKHTSLGIALGVLSLSAQAAPFTYQQIIPCLMKDNVCISYKPTQGPIVNNGAKPWFYPERGNKYGEVMVGSSKTLSFLVANVGTGPLTVYGFEKGSLTDEGMAEALKDVQYDPNPFMLTTSDCPVNSSFVLGINATCTLSVKYLPSKAGEVGDVIRMLHSSAEVKAISQDIVGIGKEVVAGTNPGSNSMPTTGGAVVSNIPRNEEVTPSMAKTALQLSTTSLKFGEINKGESSTPLAVVLTNLLDEPLAFSSKRITNGWFKFTDNCDTQLQGKSSCTLQFTMDTSSVIKPSSLDTFTVQFKEGASASVSLSGTVIGSEVLASPDPAEVIGYTLGEDIDSPIVISNSGTGPATLSNFNISNTPQGTTSSIAGFDSSSSLLKIKSHNCDIIPAGRSCEVILTANSSTEINSTQYLNYSLQNKTYSVKINTKVADADLTITPNLVDWGTVPFFSDSERSITLTNVGGKPLTGIKANLPPMFNLKSSTCSATLNAEDTCEMTISYSPSDSMAANTTRTASISNSGDIPSIPFKVKGGAEGPVVYASNTELSFGKVNPLDGLPSRTISLTNKGNTAATLSSVNVDSGNFTIKSNTCSTSLVAGSSCDITVQLTATSNGIAKGTLQVQSTSLKQPSLSIPLVADINGAILTSSVSTISFGEVDYGTLTRKSATIKNEGNMPVKLLSVRAINDRIDSTSTCIEGQSLAAKESCLIEFTLDATLNARTPAYAVVSLYSDAAKESISVSASGVAKGSYIELPAKAKTTLTKVGSSSIATTSITNLGMQPFSINTISLNSTLPDSAQWSQPTHNCANIGHMQSCSISATFTPSSYGVKNGEINFTSNDKRISSGAIQLEGEGIDGDIAFYVDGTLTKSFNFGRLPFNTLASKTISLANVGTQAIKVLTTNSANNDWTVSGCQGATLSPMTSCQFAVSTSAPFSAGAETTRNADFSFTFDKAASSSFRAISSFAGAWPSVTGPVMFEDKTPYQITKTKTVAITNMGNKPLELFAWKVLNDAAGQVSLDTSNCNAAIPANGQCALTVNYTAKNEGVFTSTITAMSNSNSTVYSSNPGQISLVVSGESASALPKLSVNMAGSATPVTRTLYLYNAGTAGLTLQSASLNMTQGSATFPKGTSSCVALAAKSYCALPITLQGTSLAGALNLKITGAAGSDGQGSFSIPLGIDPAVYPISSNEDFDFAGAHPTASPWYSAISHGNASYDANFATYDVATELALGSGPVLRFRTGYGQSINKVVAYVKNIKPYTLDLGVYDSSDASSGGHYMIPLQKVAIPAYYEGFVTINFPTFQALSAPPSGWPSLDKSWALQATEQGMTVGRYMMIYEFRVGYNAP